MRAKFSALEHTQGLHLHAKFHMNVFIVSASGTAGQNTQIWANVDILGAAVPTPFYRSEPNLVCCSRPTVYALTCQISSRSVYSVALPSVGENPQFLRVFGLRHLVVSPISSSLRKLNTVHHYKSSPIQRHQNLSVLQRLHGEIGRTISDVEKREEQTNTQTDKQKNSTFLAGPAADEIRAPPNLAR